MIKVTTKAVSRANEFRMALQANKHLALVEMGGHGMTQIDPLTPVAKKNGGALAGSNRFDVESDTVVFSNNMEYAVYVEFGHLTRSGKTGIRRIVPPQSFMRRGLNNAVAGFKKIIKHHMGV